MAWGTAYFGDEDRELTHEERVLRECHAYRRQVEFLSLGRMVVCDYPDDIPFVMFTAR
jgi:hypothetical protein